MARPGTWTKEQLLKMHAEIKESGSTIKDYCAKNNIGYHKLYQAFRRKYIVGKYASNTKAGEAENTQAAPAKTPVV
jgi:transposase-like protein